MFHTKFLLNTVCLLYKKKTTYTHTQGNLDNVKSKYKHKKHDQTHKNKKKNNKKKSRENTNKCKVCFELCGLQSVHLCEVSSFLISSKQRIPGILESI